MTHDRATTGGINARTKYETLEQQLRERDGEITTADLRHLMFLDFAEHNSRYRTSLFIGSIRQDFSDSEKRDIAWDEVITESIRLSRESTRLAFHMAFTAMVSIQQDLKEIAAVYRNIETEEQARAYNVLKGVGLKRYLPDIDTDNSGFSFNRHTATMVINVFGSMTRIRHYNAMIRAVAEWSGVKRINEVKVPELDKQIGELNTLTEAVMYNVEYCPLLDGDKKDVKATYEKWYKLFDGSLFKPDRGFKKRVFEILNGYKFGDLQRARGMLEIAAATQEKKGVMNEERYFSEY